MNGLHRTLACVQNTLGCIVELMRDVIQFVGAMLQPKAVPLALSPTGLGVKGETQWRDWDGWFTVVRNMFTWLGK